MTILEAIDGIFAADFPQSSWGARRAFLAACFALPMSPDQLDTFRLCTGRSVAPVRPASEAWVIAGRRSGKSSIAALIATYLAALARTERLSRGEWGTVLVCAVDLQQARVVMDHIRALFETPMLRNLVASETASAIELSHRVRIEVRSSNFRRVRGVTLLACILDEVAFLRDEQSALADKELVRAAKPALSTTRGLLVGISSPWARRSTRSATWPRTSSA